MLRSKKSTGVKEMLLDHLDQLWLRAVCWLQLLFMTVLLIAFDTSVSFDPVPTSLSHTPRIQEAARAMNTQLILLNGEQDLI